MKLSRKKAIELCIELWTWLAETGKRKMDWPGWEKYNVAIEHHAFCWFCYYDKHTKVGGTRARGGDCIFCPYRKKYGHCNDEGTYFEHWDEAKTSRARKKYAKLFLRQIKTLRSKLCDG